MVRCLLEPVPHMNRQGAAMSCGKYCLKSLLMWWHDKCTNNGYLHGRTTQVKIPTQKTGFLGIKKVIGFGPENYPHFDTLLVGLKKPKTFGGWITMVQANGPILVGGPDAGTSCEGYNHSLLIVGGQEDLGGQFLFYLDPIHGNPDGGYEEIEYNRIDAQLEEDVFVATYNIRELLQGGHDYFTPKSSIPGEMFLFSNTR